MKRFILLFLFALIVNVINAQESISFILKGKVQSEAKQVEVYNPVERIIQDTLNVIDGTFTYKSSLPKGTLLYLRSDTNKRNYSIVFIDGEKIELDMIADKVSGTPMNDKLNEFTLNVTNLKEKDNTQLSNYLLSQINANTNNNLGVLLLYHFAEMLSFEQLGKVVSDIEKTTMVDNPMFKQIYSYYKSEEKARAIIGTKFKDLTEKDINGNERKLSEYVGKGNYVLIDFWASWCGPCMAEVPHLKAAFDKYKSKGFNIVGLSFDSKDEAWRKAIKEKELNWVHLSDLQGWKTVAASVYGIRSIPQSLLCDGEGKVVAVNLRGEALGNKLKEIYGF